jgi:glycosyltransferase involved in cell wall biosynthesis
MSTRKLLIFESHPVQYRAPVWRELHRLAPDAVEVIYASDCSVRGHFDTGFGRAVSWDMPLLEGYPNRVLGNERGVPLSDWRSLHGRNVFKILKTSQPQAVLLSGLSYQFDWAVIFSALYLGIPIWLRAETQDHCLSRSRKKTILRSWVYRFIYRIIGHFFAIGQLNFEHYRAHGVPESKISFSRYCVVDRFKSILEQERQKMRSRVCLEAGFTSEQTVLLFSGKLQEKKNPAILLAALAAMPVADRSKYALLFVGSGELESELRKSAERIAGLSYHIAGFKNQSELPAYYLAADFLILPSLQMGETWGLVVNEAIHAGLRVIISRYVGSGADFRCLPEVGIFDGSVKDLLATLRSLEATKPSADIDKFMRQYSVEAAAESIFYQLASSGNVSEHSK